MTIPVCAVTITVTDSVGAPVSGSRVTATLDRVDYWQGTVVTRITSGTTNGSGQVTLNLFPNTIGTTGSQYRVVATDPNDTGYGATPLLDVMVLVPNVAAVALDNIICAVSLLPDPTLDGAQIAQRMAEKAAAQASDAADFWHDLTQIYLGPSATSPTTMLDGTALVEGVTYYNTATHRLMVWNGARWRMLDDVRAGVATTLFYAATAGQTEFSLSGADLNGNSYALGTGGQEKTLVSLNGVRLTEDDGTGTTGDFTLSIASNKITILSSSITAGEIVTIDVVASVDYFPIVSGAGDPAGVTTPAFLGQEYLNTTTKEWWKAHGTTSADWANITV